MKTLLVATLLIALFNLAAFAEATEHYPINRSLIGGSLGNGHGTVHLAHAVKTSILPNGKTTYTYTYQISFVGTEDMLFQWTILDRVLSGRYAFPHIFKIRNGKTYTFTLITNETPILAPGHASLFSKYLEKILLYTPEANWSIRSSEVDMYILSPGGGHGGPLPPSVLQPLQ